MTSTATACVGITGTRLWQGFVTSCWIMAVFLPFDKTCVW